MRAHKTTWRLPITIWRRSKTARRTCGGRSRPYGEALRFYTAEAAPFDYAMTQNNLANAYGALAALEDREANLRRAIAGYGEALRFYTAEAAPLDYAMTQNNLAIAYHALAALEDRDGNLWRAIAAYGEALRFDGQIGEIGRWAATHQRAMRFGDKRQIGNQIIFGIAGESIARLDQRIADWILAQKYEQKAAEHLNDIGVHLSRHFFDDPPLDQFKATIGIVGSCQERGILCCRNFCLGCHRVPHTALTSANEPRDRLMLRRIAQLDFAESHHAPMSL